MINHLNEIVFRPLRARMTSAQAIWFGRRRKLAFVYVQVFEKTSDEEWRLMCEKKPFQTHVRQGCVGPKAIVSARKRFGMPDDEWRFVGSKYDDDRYVCDFMLSNFMSSECVFRRIECILKRWERPLTLKQGRHLGALINRALQMHGIGAFKDDMSVKRMEHDLIISGWSVTYGFPREKDGKTVCRIRVEKIKD